MKFKIKTKSFANTVYVNGIKAKRLIRDCCRDIFRFNKYIIKISDPYLDQSATECQLWKKIKTKDRKYFASILQSGKIVWHGKVVSYVIQPFIEGKSRLATGKMKNRIREICFKYNIEDVHFRTGNYLIVNRNKFKIVDYGIRK